MTSYGPLRKQEREVEWAADIMVYVAEIVPAMLRFYTAGDPVTPEVIAAFTKRVREAAGTGDAPACRIKAHGLRGFTDTLTDEIRKNAAGRYGAETAHINGSLRALSLLFNMMDYENNSRFTKFIDETAMIVGRRPDSKFVDDLDEQLWTYTQTMAKMDADLLLELVVRQLLQRIAKGSAALKALYAKMAVKDAQATTKKRGAGGGSKSGGKRANHAPAAPATADDVWVGDGEAKTGDFNIASASSRYTTQSVGVVTDGGDGTFTVRVLPPAGMDADDHVYVEQVGGVQVFRADKKYHQAKLSDQESVYATLFGQNLVQCSVKSVSKTPNVQFVFSTIDEDTKVQLLFTDAYSGAQAIFRPRKADGGAKKRRIAPAPAAVAPSIATEDFESELVRLRAALRHDIKHVANGFPANAATDTKPPSEQNTHNLVAMLQALALLHTGAVRGDRGGLDGVVQIMPRKYANPKRDGTVTQAQLVNIIKGINGGDPKQKGSGIPERNPTGQLGSMDLLRKQVEPIYWGN